MALSVLTSVTTYAHDRDVTTDSNKLSLATEVEDLDATTFRAPTDPDRGWRAVRGGLKTVEAELEGFWDSAPDLAHFTGLGTADQVMTISPSGVEAEPAYAFQASRLSYEQFGEIGQICPFSLTAKSTNTVGMVRGQLAKAAGTVSATGALGSVLALGAGGAGKYLYAAFHVFTAATTITVQVQSDDAAGFASPTTRATIGPLTAVGGTWLTRVDAAAITDTHWRFNVSAITGTFTVAGAIAIQ